MSANAVQRLLLLTWTGLALVNEVRRARCEFERSNVQAALLPHSARNIIGIAPRGPRASSSRRACQERAGT